MEYESYVDKPSQHHPGVQYRLAKLSFMRRLTLLKDVWELARRYECAAGGQAASEKCEAAVLQHQIHELYWRALVLDISGMTIDGEKATPEMVLTRGPDELVTEILDVISAQFGLSPDEIKN